MNVIIAIAALGGMMIGVVITGVYMLFLSQREKRPVRKALSWKRQRKESENRATLQARMMVASGAFTDPNRR